MTNVGVDIGGTFTDLVAFVDGRLSYSKSLTTPQAPTQGVTDCLSLAGVRPVQIADFVHGSTIAINTVLERKGARTALITTRGFRDIYTIGRSNRPESFNLYFQRPKPLIPRTQTHEISARMNAAGETVRPLVDSEIDAIADLLRAGGMEAVAICLIHGYANPAHEQAVKQRLQAHLPDLFVTASHEILREFREYERTSTTALNAYVGPRVHAYLGELSSHLEDNAFRGNVQIMRSNGGTMSLQHARVQPVAMMESGPVAGVIGSALLSQVLGIAQCVAFDMGGTTAKASLISGGEPVVRDGYFIGGNLTGQPMQLPVVDIIEVGAGGGSIAWLDAQKGLHVGPQSAGAAPGPACYGIGGTQPTVTDANLQLGRLNAGRFLAGAMRLDMQAARTAIDRQIAAPLGLTTDAAAQGVLRIAASAMSLAIRGVSVDRGFDPRDCTMVAFGGGGPLHAVALAREISIPRIVVPRFPGTFSALGMLMAPWRQDFVRTLISELEEVRPDQAQALFQALIDEGEAQLRADGIAPGRAVLGYGADLRYLGQEHHIGVTLPEGLQRFGVAERAGIAELFHKAHQRHFNHASPGERIQLVNLRLTLQVPRDAEAVREILAASYVPEDERPEEMRPVVFDEGLEPRPTRVLWRAGLAPGTEIAGPAAIEEQTSTTLLHPGDVARIDAAGNILIDVKLS